MNKENSDKQLIEWNISSKIQIINIDDKKELLINGRPYMRWFSEDETAQRFAIVQLYELEFATQEEIASAFQLHINSIYNYVTAYKINGIEGLISQISGPKQSWKITPEMRFKILEVAFRNRESSYEEMVSIIERRWNKKISVNSLRAVIN